MDENEYSPSEEQADSLSSQSKSGGCSGGSSGGGSAKFRSFESGNNNVDFPSLLNVPLGSDGQGSHDSHNDSGYSTRFGYSAGPSPSLSGMLLTWKTFLLRKVAKSRKYALTLGCANKDLGLL